MKRSQGFSLIEIMVVLVIIGMLAGIVGPRVLGTAEDARKKKVQADFANVETSLKLYKLDNYVYPSTEQGLDALVSETTIEPVPRNFKNGGYMEKLPRDPWGNDYLYLSPGEHGEFDIYTLGADGSIGGEGEAADMGNWEERN
ncbi:Type II secretion system protein G [BD1-7 clade bacterium]|uniref:Type II secretion system core protein G n=1 Tax=BD1-7 clade bacterium TaxID=2029982 RepID=A0A5S9PPC1_9GAMM|nr:Type II secretion system protein G [BD1-7 clade bacterium]CAA0106332.1 Type II secretion system protein G [BD1-7 clade bacterium]